MTEFHAFHPDRARVVAIDQLGRAGSYFFQGLLDGHPEVAVLPDSSFEYGTELAGCPGPEEAARRSWERLVTVHDRIHRLPIGLDRDRFERAFAEYAEAFERSERTLFLALHWAATVAAGRDVARNRYLCYHGHSYRYTIALMRDLPDVRVILVMRDPRNAYASMKRVAILDPFFHNLHYAASYRTYYAWLRRHRSDRTMLVRHEDVHLRFAEVLDRLVAFLGIERHPSLGSSSFFGIPYTGENLAIRSVTKLYRSEPDPRYARDSWPGELSRGELTLVQRTNRTAMRECGYPIASTARLDGRGRPFDYPRFLLERSQTHTLRYRLFRRLQGLPGARRAVAVLYSAIVAFRVGRAFYVGLPRALAKLPR